MNQTFGFINAFKPPGPSSTAFGSWVRRHFGNISAGHWGTLDPRASGVLVLALGNATRLLPLIANTRKSYVCELVLGSRTDTQDSAGREIAASHPPRDAIEKVKAAVAWFAGEIEQTPPMHSAVKVAGRPLYKSARRGVSVARVARRVTVYGISVLEGPALAGHTTTVAGPANAGPTIILRLAIECGAGVYVRTLCEQIGERIGVPAHMGALVRTAAGPFGICAAKLPFEIARDPRGSVIDPLSVLEHPRITISPSQADRFVHGNPLEIAGDPPTSDVIVMRDGHLLGIGTVKADRAGWLFPTRVLTSDVSA